MTPIEIIAANQGAKILTGTTDTNLSSLTVVAVVIRSAGATLTKLEIADSDVRAARGLDGEALDAQDIPILAGVNIGSNPTTKTFSQIQLANATDSVWLIFGE